MTEPSSGSALFDEHEGKLDSLWDSYADLYERVKSLENLVYELTGYLRGAARLIAERYPG